MKVKHIIVIFLLGVVFMAIGGAFKFMHWPGASVMILISSCLHVGAGIFAIWKVLSMEKFREFLNS